MRIAIVGAGISGLTAAARLHGMHDIVVYESSDWIGGHTHTVDVEEDGRAVAVDTGFIVFNDWTYPEFIALLAGLGVASQPSDMSFSLVDERAGLEYNGTSLNTLFAQRRNLLRPSFLGMLADIVRFNRDGKRFLSGHDPDTTLADFLRGHRYGAAFVERMWRKWSPGWRFSPAVIGTVRRRLADAKTMTSALEYYRQVIAPRPGDAARSQDLFGGVQQVRTLGVAGEQDNCISADVFCRAMRAEDFPGGLEVRRIEGAGHFMHQEQPEAATRLLIDWLRRSPGGRAAGL